MHLLVYKIVYQKEEILLDSKSRIRFVNSQTAIASRTFVSAGNGCDFNQRSHTSRFERGERILTLFTDKCRVSAWPPQPVKWPAYSLPGAGRKSIVQLLLKPHQMHGS